MDRPAATHRLDELLQGRDALRRRRRSGCPRPSCRPGRSPSTRSVHWSTVQLTALVIGVGEPRLAGRDDGVHDGADGVHEGLAGLRRRVLDQLPDLVENSRLNAATFPGPSASPGAIRSGRRRALPRQCEPVSDDADRASRGEVVFHEGRRLDARQLGHLLDEDQLQPGGAIRLDQALALRRGAGQRCPLDHQARPGGSGREGRRLGEHPLSKPLRLERRRLERAA